MSDDRTGSNNSWVLLANNIFFIYNKTFERLLPPNVRDSLFWCQDGTYTLSHHVCDGHPHCSDEADEEDCSDVCTCHQQSDCFNSCHAMNCSCSSLYFQCTKIGGCVPKSKICDCYFDCIVQSDEADHLCSYTTCETIIRHRSTTHHKNYEEELWMHPPF